jgi:small subunit ribosomal protein S6e
MAFKLVISDPKTRKSWQKEVSGEGILGKKIGDKFSGTVAGLEGYELQITGGSDSDGFPMRKDIEGTARKRVLLSGGVGFKPRLEGQRKRKSIRGNTVSQDAAQVNSKVVKYGKVPLEKVLGAAAKEEKKEEPAPEEKEEAPQEKEETPAEAKEEEAKPETAEAEEPAMEEEKKE